MKLRIEIERQGKPEQLVTRPADLAAWEQWSGKLVRDWGTTPPSFTDVLFLTYRADTNGRRPRPDFQEWMDSDGLELEEATLRADDANPSLKAAGEG